MSIRFNSDKWEKIKADSQKWWMGQLNRPLIQARLFGADSGREKPSLECWDAVTHWFSDFLCKYDSSVTAEQIIDRWDYALCSTKYIGDAFPCVWPNFGPGIVAAFLGASVHTTTDTVWFEFSNRRNIESIHVEFDRENNWFQRVTDIAYASQRRWQGAVQVAFPDLGGIFDILASLRGVENLIYDMVDTPEHVIRLSAEIQKVWHDSYSHFEKIYESNHGFTSWEGVFSDQWYSILQSDFSYMINNELFNRFIKPNLVASSRAFARSFYHLDGPGQLKHLDSILEIESIQGIQWIPGAGQPDISQWPEVYKKIHDAGKLIQIFDFQYCGDGDILEILQNQIGDLRGVLMMINASVAEQARIEDFMAKYL